MPRSTVLGMPPEEHAQFLAALRRVRYGYRLGLHIVLGCAGGGTPTAIAAALFCSRSRVDRTIRAYRAGPLGWEPDEAGERGGPVRTTVLLPPLQRSLGAWRRVSPQVYGWCRTRWSGATWALTRHTTRGITGSAEPMRRWRHERGWGWQRAKLVAKDDDPCRVARLAQSRWVFEPRQRTAALVFADAREGQLLPKVGCAWRPKGTPGEIMPPGQPQKPALAGARELAPGTLHDGLGPRTPTALLRDLLALLEPPSPAERYPRLYGVGDTDKIPKAQAVEQGLAAHPRVTLLLLPPDCPGANPIARAFGDVHDCCTRHHRRKR